MDNKLRARRTVVIIGVGVFLISSELLAFGLLHHFLDGFAHGVGTLAERATGVVQIVSAASKLTTLETQQPANQQGGSDATPPEEIKFKLLGMSNGMTKNGFTFGGMTYETTTHINVYVKVVHLDSREGAKKEYDDRLKEAVRIIDQGKVQDQPATKPATTEDRAVVIVPATSKDCKEMFTVLATAGTALRILQSCSLEVVVDLEKRGKRGERLEKSAWF